MTKSFDHLQDELQARGISWNAYTSTNEVVFWLTGLEEELTPYRNKILHCLENFNITTEQFETERSIVLQEYKDYFTSQYWTHFTNVVRRRFENYDPIGRRDDLEALTLENLQAMFETWYRRPTKIINVSNRYHHMDTEKLRLNVVEDSVLRPGRWSDSDQGVPLELGNNFEANSSVVMQTEPISQDVPALKIIANMLSSGLNSPLFQEVREKRGLCYGIWCTLSRFNLEYLFNITSTTADHQVDQLLDVTKEVISNQAKYLTAERLEVVRRSLQIDDQIEAINRYSNVAPWLTPPQFQARAVQDTIQLDEIHRVAKLYINPDKLHVSVDKRDFQKS